MGKFKGIKKTGGLNVGDFLGMFNFHNVVMCDSEDNSIYCSIMKLLNLVFAIIFLTAIFYFIYIVFLTKSDSRKG